MYPENKIDTRQFFADKTEYFKYDTFPGKFQNL